MKPENGQKTQFDTQIRSSVFNFLSSISLIIWRSIYLLFLLLLFILVKLLTHSEHLLPQSSIPLDASFTVEVPFGQLMQALFRSSEEYVPKGHLKHFATPVEE